MTTKNRNDDHGGGGGGGITAVTAELVTEATPIMNRNNPNHGTWNSGLCACCKYGCCHPALWCACCFPMLFMGQLLTRMKLTWFGDATTAASSSSYSSPSDAYKNTFCTVAMIWVGSSLLTSLLYCPLQIPNVREAPLLKQEQDLVFPTLDMIENPECPYWRYCIGQLVPFVTGVYTLLVMMKLRNAIRTEYHIHEGKCNNECGDCCCIWCCGCCTAIQLAHQTTNYDEVAAACCTSTGLFSPSTTHQSYDTIHTDNGIDDGDDEDEDDNDTHKITTVFTPAVIV